MERLAPFLLLMSGLLMAKADEPTPHSCPEHLIVVGEEEVQAACMGEYQIDHNTKPGPENAGRPIYKKVTYDEEAGEHAKYDIYLFYHTSGNCWVIDDQHVEPAGWVSKCNVLEECPTGMTEWRVTDGVGNWFSSGRLRVWEMDCPPAVSVVGTADEAFLGSYEQVEVERDEENSRRPIFKNANGKFLFWWEDWHAWAISDAYREHTHEPSYKSLDLEHLNEPCPTLIVQWGVRRPGIWSWEPSDLKVFDDTPDYEDTPDEDEFESELDGRMDDDIDLPEL